MLKVLIQCRPSPYVYYTMCSQGLRTPGVGMRSFGSVVRSRAACFRVLERQVTCSWGTLEFKHGRQCLLMFSVVQNHFSLLSVDPLRTRTWLHTIEPPVRCFQPHLSTVYIDDSLWICHLQTLRPSGPKSLKRKRWPIGRRQPQEHRRHLFAMDESMT